MENIKFDEKTNDFLAGAVRLNPRCLSNTSCAIEATKPFSIEKYSDRKELERFMLRVGGETIAAGLVTEILINQKHKITNVSGDL